MSNISEQINYLNILFATNPDFNKLPLSISFASFLNLSDETLSGILRKEASSESPFSSK